MQALPVQFAFLVAFVPLAYTQTTTEKNIDREFNFRHSGSTREIQEIATAIRTIAEIRQVSTDTAKKSMTVRATANQMALADWLLNQLDQPRGTLQNRPAADLEYRSAGDPEDTVRIFYLAYADTEQQLQEIAIGVSFIAEIRRACTNTILRAVILRGTADQLTLGEWLLSALDQPERVDGTPARPLLENRPNGGPNDVVRILYLPANTSFQELQEFNTLVRTQSDMRYAFVYHTPRVAVFRANADQVSLAGWLFDQLYGSSVPGDRDRTKREFMLPSDGPSFVSLYFLKGAAPDLESIALRIRSAARTSNVFFMTRLRALSVRGTAGQIALADRLIDMENGKLSGAPMK